MFWRRHIILYQLSSEPSTCPRTSSSSFLTTCFPTSGDNCTQGDGAFYLVACRCNLQGNVRPKKDSADCKTLQHTVPSLWTWFLPESLWDSVLSAMVAVCSDSEQKTRTVHICGHGNQHLLLMICDKVQRRSRSRRACVCLFRIYCDLKCHVHHSCTFSGPQRQTCQVWSRSDGRFSTCVNNRRTEIPCFTVIFEFQRPQTCFLLPQVTQQWCHHSSSPSSSSPSFSSPSPPRWSSVTTATVRSSSTSTRSTPQTRTSLTCTASASRSEVTTNSSSVISVDFRTMGAHCI